MNFPLIANIVVFVVLLFALAQESGEKSAGGSGDGCGFWPCPAYHLWF